jgi:hypothetical protein
MYLPNSPVAYPLSWSHVARVEPSRNEENDPNGGVSR